MLKALFFTDKSLRQYRNDLQKSLDVDEISITTFNKSLADVENLAEGVFEGKTVYVMIEKSNEDNLEKGGEGSKGGKVIGHTKSGHPIYDSKDRVKVNEYYTSNKGDKTSDSVAAHTEERGGEKVVKHGNKYHSYAGHYKVGEHSSAEEANDHIDKKLKESKEARESISKLVNPDNHDLYKHGFVDTKDSAAHNLIRAANHRALVGTRDSAGFNTDDGNRKKYEDKNFQKELKEKHGIHIKQRKDVDSNGNFWNYSVKNSHEKNKE